MSQRSVQALSPAPSASACSRRRLPSSVKTAFPAPACWILSPVARVSKRDLYALFNNKHAAVSGMHQRTRPTDAPALGPDDSCATDPRCARHIARLSSAVSILKTVCQPEVLTVFRLAIAESDRAPEIARTLHSSGRQANQKALTELVRKAQALRVGPGRRSRGSGSSAI